MTIQPEETPMPGSYDNGVTIGIAAADPPSLLQAMEERHDGPHDTLVIFIPPGMARDARDRIWQALDTAPRQHQSEFERDQALAYEGNIARMSGSL
jgi:hypothetical protein